MNKQEIIHKIKSIEGLSQTERAYLIELVNTKKRYGLVWEDKAEDVEELLRQSLPILKEVIEKRVIGTDIQSEIKTPNNELFAIEETNQDILSSPNHILIEGENLQALTALSFTHENKIDFIYIDPPYNTGNKDFKYNDSFVDKEDGYRHSKWLSFLNKRLLIAKRLLSNTGVIFISIDDNEQAQLKLLCDEIFGADNLIENVIWKNKYGAGAKTVGFISVHEYVYCYSKQPLKNLDVALSVEDQNKYNKTDEKYNIRGGYITQPLMTKSLGDRPNLVYPITYKDEQIMPDKQWVWAKERLEKAISNNEIVFSKERGKWSVRSKQYLKDEYGNIRRGKPLSILNGPFTQEGTEDLRTIFGKEPFGFPKPMSLIKYFLSFQFNDFVNKSIIILDFFAGSGTTLHATMQLNAEDGGNRQCILVTNNENNICEEVTYERNKKIIQGFENNKAENINGLLHNNLRYYKTDFIQSVKSEENKRLLTQSSTDMLCIKEDCYNDITEANGFNKKQCSILTNDTGKYLIIVYHSRQQLQICDQLVDYIKTIKDISEKVRLYAFSPEKETLSEDFIEVADKIDAVPLPEAIYNAYRATFRAIKLDKKQAVSKTISASQQESESPLFNPNQIEA